MTVKSHCIMLLYSKILLQIMIIVKYYYKSWL